MLLDQPAESAWLQSLTFTGHGQTSTLTTAHSISRFPTINGQLSLNFTCQCAQIFSQHESLKFLRTNRCRLNSSQFILNHSHIFQAQTMQVPHSRASRNAERRAVFIPPPVLVAMWQQSAYGNHQFTPPCPQAFLDQNSHTQAIQVPQPVSPPIMTEPPPPQALVGDRNARTMEAVTPGGYGNIEWLYHDKSRLPFFDVVRRGH